MKSYNNLWDDFLSNENIVDAINKSAKGKKNRKVVAKISSNPEKFIDDIRKYAANFHNFKHHPIEIYDGVCRKKRIIIVPKYEEQIVHHMVANILIPIFMKGMYKHSYGSIPGRGAHKGKKRIEKWIREDRANVKYCLKMDIKKFFPSINHDILRDKLAGIIKDKKFLNVLYEIIDATPVGIPLGFYTSQWLANWYLQDLDHFIKEKLGVKHYIRYVDDMVIFGSNKRKLHAVKDAINEYLENNLGLRLKENWQVFRFDHKKKGKDVGRCLDFIGFKFYRHKTVMRKSIMIKVTRKAKKISKKERATLYDIRQMLSYLGWIDCTDTYTMYTKKVKPYVKFGKMKKKISEHDKFMNKSKKEELEYELSLQQVAVKRDASAD